MFYRFATEPALETLKMDVFDCSRAEADIEKGIRGVVSRFETDTAGFFVVGKGTDSALTQVLRRGFHAEHSAIFHPGYPVFFKEVTVAER